MINETQSAVGGPDKISHHTIWKSAQENSFDGIDFKTYLNVIVRQLTRETDAELASREEKFSDNFDFKNYINLFSKNSKFVVVHNRNDFLLRSQDVEFYKKYFGNRFTLFDYGGHCGNYWFPAYQDFFRQILKSAN